MTDKQLKEALEALDLLDNLVAQATGLTREGTLKAMNATMTIKAALEAKAPADDAKTRRQKPGELPGK